MKDISDMTFDEKLILLDKLILDKQFFRMYWLRKIEEMEEAQSQRCDEAVDKFIREYLAKGYTLEEIAEEIGVPQSYLEEIIAE